MGPHIGNIKSETHIIVLYIHVETILIWVFLEMALYKTLTWNDSSQVPEGRWFYRRVGKCGWEMKGSADPV